MSPILKIIDLIDTFFILLLCIDEWYFETEKGFFIEVFFQIQATIVTDGEMLNSSLNNSGQ